VADAYLRGLNMAGGEFAHTAATLPGVYGTDYSYDTAAALAQIASYGHKVIRLPFRWERIQPTRNAALNATELGRLHAFVNDAKAAGMQVILDVHNYGRYINSTANGDAELILGDTLPVADLVDLWKRLSVFFAGNPGVYAYDLMNEPHDLPGAAGAFAGTVRYDWSDGVQGWTGDTATASVVGGQLRLSKTMSAGYSNIRKDDAGTKRGGALTGTVLEAVVTLGAGVTGSWRALLQYQNTSYQWVSPASTTYTRVDSGAVVGGLVAGVAVRVRATHSAIASPNAFAIQIEANDSAAVTVTADVDNFSQGSVAGSSTPAEFWESVTQQLVTAIRGQGDNGKILVPGYAYSGAKPWPTNHPDKWITDPVNNHAYTAHFYWDADNDGDYSVSYAAENTAAINNGHAGLAARAVAELGNWLNWLSTNGVQGFLGEFGWTNTDDDAAWNATGEAVYDALDAAGVGGTYWAAGARWGDGYNLSAYTGTTQAVRQPQAAIIEAHLSTAAVVQPPPSQPVTPPANAPATSPATSPIVVPAPELNARFDPRTGTTGPWLGCDGFASVPLGDAAGRTAYLGCDTWWADGDTTPGSRSGAYMTSDSIIVQTGPDLATAAVTFHQGTGANLRFFPISATHYSWPMGGVVIGDDLYVTSMRVLQASPLGGEYGWAIHRIPNARTTQVGNWQSTLLYESGDTGTRPIWSPYVDGGYVHAFAIKRSTGWLWCRWPLAAFTGTGTQGAVEYFTGVGWSTDEAQAFPISENANTSEGSVHRRAVDGRWMITDSVGPLPFWEGGVRLGSRAPDGSFPVVTGGGGYYPPPPAFQPGDHVRDESNFDAVVQSVNANGTRVIKYTPFWGGGTATKTAAQLTAKNSSDRAVYKNPRYSQTPLPDSYLSYAHKAHPSLQGPGLVVSFVDNAAGVPAMDIYWPKFYRVLPPTVTGLSVNADGLASWTLGGAPDRVRIRLDGGAWTELAATAGSHQLDGYAPGQAVEVQAIGIGGASGRTVNGVTDETPAVGGPPRPPSSADWLVWPREPDLSRSFDPLSGADSLVVVERNNRPDGWVISGPSSVLEVFSTPGMGAILDRDGEQVTSGDWTNLRRWTEAGVESMEVAFASDLSIFRLARPEQATTMLPNVPKRFTKGYDTFTGAREDAILHYLKASAGGTALPDRRVARLRFPTSLGRGGHTSTSARFDELGPLIQSLAEAANLRVAIVHTEDASGPWLDVKITESADLSEDVRFGTSDTTAAGLITDWEYEIGAPTATRALVMGGGELQMRVGLEVRDAAAEELWGTVAEVLVDQRQSDPLDDEALIGTTSKALAEAKRLVTKSITDDQFLRRFVAGANAARVATQAWGWLNGWDLVRALDLPADRLPDISRDIGGTTAEDSTLSETLDGVADAWRDVRQMDDDIRRPINDALEIAWEDQNNELGVAIEIIEATNAIDARVAAAQAVLTRLNAVVAQYGPASASHWAARVAAVVLELGDAGREVLAERAGPTSVTFTPTLGPNLEYRRDVRVGDRVGVDLPGLPPITEKIREATTTVSVEPGQPTERVQVVVGTPDAPTSRTQQQTARALRELSQLKRSK